MTGTDTGSVAVACLQSWSRGDFDTTRALLTDDVTFVGPLGATNGVDDYMRGIRGVADIVERIDVQQVVADRDEVCVIYDLVTSTGAGALPTAAWYSLRDGRIAAIRAYFDPRPLTASG
jgi:ketosteroid isomerase-like protein